MGRILPALLLGLFLADAVAGAGLELPLGPDYRQRGPHRFETQDASLMSETGCTVTYRSFKPRPMDTDVWVMLGHGFMRSKERMQQLAEHLASWRIPVVTVDFCNSKWWKGNHDRNAADMLAIAQALIPGRVIYSGFSAGGLAALLAAARDPNAVAYLGLDMVDNGRLGEQAASRMKIPLYGLAVEPAACNARNNGLGVYERAGRAVVFKLSDASHCHFEFPMDWKCTLVCGRGEERFERPEIQRTILGLAASFARWHGGFDQQASQWWRRDGQNFRALLAGGQVEKLLARGDAH